MAKKKGAIVKIRLVSEEGTGVFYTTTVNKKTMTKKLRKRKYDKKLKAYAWFKEEKIK